MNDRTDQATCFRRARPLLLVGARLLLAAFALTFVPAGAAQEQPKAPNAEEKKPSYSEGEIKAAKKTEAADAAAALQAGTEFLKKYSKSGLRPEVARVIAVKIDALPDTTQKIDLFEKFFSAFTDASEYNNFAPALIDAYLKANRLDDAFQTASSYFAKNPGDAITMSRVAITGVGQVQRGEKKHAAQSQQLAAKAIEVIEANQKPANATDAQWADYRGRGLGQLYQAVAVLAMDGGDLAGAKAKLEKSISLNSSDPFSYALLGNMINDEYQQMAQQYNATPAGAAKEELLQKSQAKLDEVIDAYAHTLALSDGKPEFKALHDQIAQAIEPYYKFRHNNSTEGLQALIDKYKKPAAPAQ
jgi:hypothetical protein